MDVNQAIILLDMIKATPQQIDLARKFIANRAAAMASIRVTRAFARYEEQQEEANMR